jgi:hypothetical protein
MDTNGTNNIINFQGFPPYDQLAVSYMLNPDYDAQKDWYGNLLKKDANNFKAIYGLALT